MISATDIIKYGVIAFVVIQIYFWAKIAWEEHRKKKEGKDKFSPLYEK